MTDIFQEIREQIHEIRNEIAPVDFRLAKFEDEIAEYKIFCEQKAAALEAKVFANSLRLEEQSRRIASLLDRLQWIEFALQVPPRPTAEPLPANGTTVIQPQPQPAR